MVSTLDVPVGPAPVGDRRSEDHPEGRAGRPGRVGTPTADVLAAVVGLLAEVGYEAMTLDAVAQRAHVSKATLYKRWDGKPRLVVAALRARSLAAVPQPGTGALRTDLLSVARRLNAVEDRTGPLLAALAHAVRQDPSMAAAVETELAEPCREVVREIVAGAVARGESTARPDDLGPAADVLPAMVVLPMLLTGRRLDDTEIVALVDRVVLPLLT